MRRFSLQFGRYVSLLVLVVRALFIQGFRGLPAIQGNIIKRVKTP